MKSCEQMLRSPAFLALGASARSTLRVVMEEIDNPAASVQLETNFFLTAGLSNTALSTGIRDLTALAFIRLTGSRTAARTFTLADSWREIADQAEARRCLAAAKAAQRPPRRPRAVPAKAAADDAGNGRLPDGVRRAVWPQLAWQQGDAT